MKKIITLTTDFGREDFYVGEMKGVILGIDDEIKIVDITHEISPQNIFQGAFVISQIWKYFPKGTIHLGVIDPGVGSSRKGLIIKTEQGYFIGPDNGLFSLVLKGQKVKRIVKIEKRKIKEIFQRDISKTFHGRDIFAPVAALIAKGKEMEKFGKKIRKIVELKLPRKKIIYIDHFGNLITSLPEKILEKYKGERITLKHKNKKIKVRVVETFSEGERGEFLLLRGSHNFLELDVREGNAAKKLKAKVGDKITLN